MYMSRHAGPSCLTKALTSIKVVNRLACRGTWISVWLPVFTKSNFAPVIEVMCGSPFALTEAEEDTCNGGAASGAAGGASADGGAAAQGGGGGSEAPQGADAKQSTDSRHTSQTLNAAESLQVPVLCVL
mmetsp:Transcript_6502/g.17721  ORF Transcript_6502/g.17721 Transcript_6502/m.17721 type:complete len:129 (+) Transcript_6502:242-628(+)